MKLVDDIKDAPKWWSMRLGAAILVLELGQQLLPVWGDYLPAWVTPVLVTALLVARTVKQEIHKHV